MDELTRRVERLERESRRWRCGAVLAAAALGVLLAAGAGEDPPRVLSVDSISTKAVLIREETGLVRASLRSAPDGTVKLTFSGPGQFQQSVDRASFGVTLEGEPSIRFTNDGGFEDLLITPRGVFPSRGPAQTKKR
jgi:hypothetical protein